MFKSFRQTGRRWGYLLVRRRVAVAWATFFFFAFVSALDFARNFDAYGSAFVRDWIEISGYITSPLLFALLVYIALRASAREVRAENLATAIVSNAPIGIFSTDREGRITFANKKLTELLSGIEMAQILGVVVPELPAIAGTALEQTFRNALRGEAFTVHDFEYAPATGAPRFFTAYGVPLRDALGILDGVMVLLEDTSERRQWQREIQARSEEAQRHARELEILRDISIGATATLDLDEVLRLVYERVASATSISTFFIGLYDEASNELHFEFRIDDGVRVPKFSRRLDQSAGLSGWIIQHRTPLLLDDLQDTSKLPTQPNMVGRPSRSWLGVPLIAKDRVIGVMSAQSYQPNQFDQNHQRLFVAIANQISVVIENARLFAQTRQRAQELQVANDIARAINSTLNLDEVLNLFFERVNALFNVEAGSLVLHDPLTNELVFEVVHGGAGESLLHKRMQSDRGIVGWVTLHGDSVLVPDVRLDARWSGEMDATTSYVTRSILAAPIRVQERTIGVIELINRRNGIAFDTADKNLLEMFAVSAGIAIENARLHRQTQQRLAEVSMLNTIANQLASSLDLDQILATIVTRLKLLFTCRAVSIHLLLPDHQFLDLRASSGLAPEQPVNGIRIGTGIAGRVVLEGTMRYVRRADDAPSDARLNPATQSLLTVPLMSRERILGTLSLDSSTPNAFSEDNQRLLTIVASQIATAIENAQLYRDSKDRAERLRAAYEELQELDLLKTEFTQNISHELRTPLTFIKGYVELLRDDSLGDLSAKAREALDIVANKTDALIELVNSILSLQQVEASKLRVSMVRMDELARQAVRGAQATAQKVKVELCEEIAAHLPPIAGDAERLMQVLDNLLSNAIKFSPHGGKVCVRVRELDGNVQVDVQDSGIGIAREKLPLVFERFYQVDGSATRRFGGTGLGLAIVKRIVELHNGRVWAESDPGKGSTFSFAIPIVAQQVAPAISSR